MKKLFTLIILSLCLLVSSIAMAKVQKLNPDDFLGTWYFTAMKMEDQTVYTAPEKNHEWRLHFYEQNGELFVSYMDDARNEPYETQITLVPIEVEESIVKQVNNFRAGSHYKMLRQYDKSIDEFQIFLPKKDLLVLKTFYRLDGARSTYEAEFSRTNPLEAK